MYYCLLDHTTGRKGSTYLTTCNATLLITFDGTPDLRFLNVTALLRLPSK